MNELSTLTRARFSDSESATEAVSKLVESSQPPDQMQVWLLRPESAERIPIQYKTRVVPGLLVGSVVGAATVGIGLALSTMGVGMAHWHIVAESPWVAAVQGALAGGLVGGIVGTLAGLGFWRRTPDLPAELPRHGEVVVEVVSSPNRSNRICEMLRAAGAQPMSYDAHGMPATIGRSTGTA